MSKCVDYYIKVAFSKLKDTAQSTSSQLAVMCISMFNGSK